MPSFQKGKQKLHFFIQQISLEHRNYQYLPDDEYKVTFTLRQLANLREAEISKRVNAISNF